MFSFSCGKRKLGRRRGAFRRCRTPRSDARRLESALVSRPALGRRAEEGGKYAGGEEWHGYPRFLKKPLLRFARAKTQKTRSPIAKTKPIVGGSEIIVRRKRSPWRFLHPTVAMAR